MNDIDDSKNRTPQKRENAPLPGQVKEFAVGIIIVAMVILLLLMVGIVATYVRGVA